MFIEGNAHYQVLIGQVTGIFLFGIYYIPLDLILSKKIF